MRDINRIDPFLQNLGELWKYLPDYRFGQLIYKLAGELGQDIFFPEEDVCMDKFETMVQTYEHKRQVSWNITNIVHDLLLRSLLHDDTKLESPEVEIFAEYTPKLANTTYGSEEYRQYLKEMQVALDHHYANNNHHPECHIEGIKGMTLVDLTEMICDWVAATMRHDDGDIYKSLEINQERFGYSDELKQIFKNTVDEYF